MTRAFVAIPLPEGLQDGIARVQDRLPAGRPVDPETLHLTLAFLDDQTDDALEELDETLSGLSEPAFDLRLTGLGTFGKAPLRTLWLDVAPEPRLLGLEKAVRRAVRRAGIDMPSRRFVPHVTLARFPAGFVEDAAFTRFAATHAGIAFDPFSVSEIRLYASTLTKSGPIHETLAVYPLVRVNAGET